MKKVLFLIHDLGGGGAEKVLVNLVNHMDPEKYDITVISLFGGGVNEQYLLPHIHYKAIWKHAVRGNSQYMKLLSPEQLHRICIKESYDVEIAYLEGPSTRLISGCTDPNTRLIAWVHIEQQNTEKAAHSYRSYGELLRCYDKFERVVCVSKTVKEDFLKICPDRRNVIVRYNTIETDKILAMKDEPVEDVSFNDGRFHLAAVGKIIKTKGFDRLVRIVKQLQDDGLQPHLLILGRDHGEQSAIEQYIENNHINDCVTFLGYQENPYKYVSRCDLFVCASWAEGFSTAATEAIIVGTPVCTVEVSGMKEMLGENNEWGVVTDNDTESLYQGIKQLITDSNLLEFYRRKAKERSSVFSERNTVRAIEELIG